MIRVSFVLQVTAKIARLDCDDGSQGALESGRYFAGIIAITSPVTGSTFLTDGAAPSDPYFLSLTRPVNYPSSFFAELFFGRSSRNARDTLRFQWRLQCEQAATGVAMNRD